MGLAGLGGGLCWAGLGWVVVSPPSSAFFSAVSKSNCVHGDLKPANVLLAHGAPFGHVAKVSDFGLSKLVYWARFCC